MKLPKQFIADQLKDIAEGQSVYVTPWTMWVDNKGECYIDESAPFTEMPAGTSCLRITATDSGYIAHIYELENPQKWTRKGSPSFVWDDLAACYGPVQGFGEKPN